MDHEEANNPSAPEETPQHPNRSRRLRELTLATASVAVILLFGLRIADQLDIERDQLRKLLVDNLHWLLIGVGGALLLRATVAGFRRMPFRLSGAIALTILLTGTGRWYLITWPVNGLGWSRGNMPMVWIPPGSIEYTNHLGRVSVVTVDHGFWIDRMEATGIVSRPGWNRRDRWITYREEDSYNRVISMVSWQDAVQSCQTCTESTDARMKIPDNFEYRLPSTNEWIYACLYSLQKSTSDAPIPIHYDGTRRGPVTRKPDRHRENGEYLLDMTGNLWEWCADELPPPVPTLSEDVTRPPEIFRAAMGGGWNSPLELCMPDSMIALHEQAFYRYAGYRMVLSRLKDPQ